MAIKDTTDPSEFFSKDHPGTFRGALGHFDTELSESILHLVTTEFIRATKKNGTFNSHHEGWAVIYEELDELWDEVRVRQPDNGNLLREAIQTAAMAIRFIHDLVPATLILQTEKDESRG